MCKKPTKTFDNETLYNIFKTILMVFILIVGITCLIGLIICICSFIRNQELFSVAHANAAIDIAASNDKQFIEQSISHLEKLQKIQKDAATNDVMSFIYSMLSTVLVALCAGFVAKSYNNVDKAKEAVEKAKKNAENSKASSLTAQKNADSSSEYADMAQNCATTAENTSKELKDILNGATQLYDDATIKMNKQSNALNIMAIHIEIIQARAALVVHDKINANQRIYNILRKVESIKESADKDIILQLQAELLSLETAVEIFREYANQLVDSLDKTSILNAISRYEDSLNKCVEHCESLLKI